MVVFSAVGTQGVGIPGDGRGENGGKCGKVRKNRAVGFSLPGGGGGGRVNRAPKNWGGGFRKRAQLTGTINQSL